MILNQESYRQIATSAYDNNSCLDEVEFEYDLSRPKRVRSMLKRYREGKSINYRMVLNHIIIYRNCFGSLAPQMLALWNRDELPLLCSLLDTLGITPDVFVFDGMVVATDAIERDQGIKEGVVLATR